MVSWDHMLSLYKTNVENMLVSKDCGAVLGNHLEPISLISTKTGEFAQGVFLSHKKKRGSNNWHLLAGTHKEL